jgi:PIN domain nuclease of toxin-antitoxin system
MILLDTSALLFWTIDPKKLSPTAKQMIEAEEAVLVSSISIWEIAQKVKRARLEISIGLNQWIKGLYHLGKLEILSVDVDMWLSSVALDWDHRDPADRVIVATASLLNCPLITSDRVITNYYAAAIW